MSARNVRLLLWAVLLAVAPMPYFLVETGREPVARLLQLLAASLALMAEEGSAGALALTSALLAGQALLWSGVLALVAVMLGALLDRAFGAKRGQAAWVLIGFTLAVASIAPIYHTPFRTASLDATLLQVFQ